MPVRAVGAVLVCLLLCGCESGDDKGRVTPVVGPQKGVVAGQDDVVLMPEMSAEAIQNAVDTYPEGTTFFFKPGTYRDVSIVPRQYQKFVGAYGAILTSSTKEYAFRGPGTNGVVIRNLIIDGYVPSHDWRESITTGDYWKLSYLECRKSTMGGPSLNTGTSLTHCYIHHNEQLGISAAGPNIVIEDNDISYNNPHAKHDTGWEAGGAKFWKTIDIVLKGNNIHHNVGDGVSFDTDNDRAKITGNWLHDNTLCGIIWEVSFAAKIDGNLCEGNGSGATDPDWLDGSGILLSSGGQNVTITNNVVRNNANGICVISVERADGHPPQNVSIQRNKITMSGKCRTGCVGDTSGEYNSFDGGLVWDRNEYVLSGGAGFAWQNPTNKRALSWAEWQQTGHDRHSKTSATE